MLLNFRSCMAIIKYPIEQSTILGINKAQF